MCPPAKVNSVWSFNDAWLRTSLSEARRQAPRNGASILDAARELGIRDAQVPDRYSSRQRPTLQHTCACSTVGGGSRNFRVRNGNGCAAAPRTTGELVVRGPAGRNAALSHASSPCRSSRTISKNSLRCDRPDENYSTPDARRAHETFFVPSEEVPENAQDRRRGWHDGDFVAGRQPRERTGVTGRCCTNGAGHTAALRLGGRDPDPLPPRLPPHRRQPPDTGDGWGSRHGP